MAGRKAALGAAWAAAAMVLLAPQARAGYEEYWWFTHGYTASEANKAAGPDLLPMTADDMTVALNLHGYLSTETIDNDPGAPGYDHGFHIRNDPGGIPTDELDAGYMTLTRHTNPDVGPHFGLLLDGENWTDNRRDDGGGATGGGPIATGNWDWEQNDSAPTGPGWESAINYFWYNNAAANQRGLGGSRYYFEYKSPDLAPGQVMEEPEGYRYYNTLRLTTAGTSRSNIARNFEKVEIRGLLIPISAIHALPHGSLHPLFGWQSVDMADWVREKIGPLVDASGNPTPAGGLKAWANSDRNNSPPYEYVMIFQSDEPIAVADGQQTNASTLGIVSGVSRARRTYVLFKGNTLQDPPTDNDNPPLSIATPAQTGPVMVNSWGLDDMYRNGGANPGNLQFGPGGGWAVHVDDSAAADGRASVLPANAPAGGAWIKLPTLRLPARNMGVILGKAVVRLDLGNVEGNAIQIALVDGDNAVASGGFKVGRPPTVGLGGSIAGGPVSGSIGTPEPPTPDGDGDGDVDGADYTVFAGCATGPNIPTVSQPCRDLDFDQDADIDQEDFGIFQRCWSGSSVPFDSECAPSIGTKIKPGSAYITLALWYDATAGTVRLTLDGQEIAAYSGGPVGANVNGLYVWTGSAEKFFVDSMTVQSGAFACSVTPGDLDGDGDADADDNTAKQACYSGAGKPYRTGILPSCACLDKDGDYDVDEADGVTP